MKYLKKFNEASLEDDDYNDIEDLMQKLIDDFSIEKVNYWDVDGNSQTGSNRIRFGIRTDNGIISTLDKFYYMIDKGSEVINSDGKRDGERSSDRCIRFYFNKENPMVDEFILAVNKFGERLRKHKFIISIKDGAIQHKIFKNVMTKDIYVYNIKKDDPIKKKPINKEVDLSQFVESKFEKIRSKYSLFTLEELDDMSKDYEDDEEMDYYAIIDDTSDRTDLIIYYNRDLKKYSKLVSDLEEMNNDISLDGRWKVIKFDDKKYMGRINLITIKYK